MRDRLVVQTETDIVDNLDTKGYRNQRIDLELDTPWIRDDSQASPLARSFPAATVDDPSRGARANSPPSRSRYDADTEREAYERGGHE
ncbi:hypothetical protein EXIGLDRAFT_783059 [Exidia glandulosa HHB12029]|uniref:Uncharacterized protein n=1 Tax=Exidia glandulosa HHB12029 TaxID=1314781 RepID=A0A166NA09_EXIGL|nr:hypothetical protein EXIGLDRAFT_783059 [Exidia glandulosa HHB12029]